MIETLAVALVTPFALATAPEAPAQQSQIEQSIQMEDSLPKIEQYNWNTQNATPVTELEKEAVRFASANGTRSYVSSTLVIDDWNSD